MGMFFVESGVGGDCVVSDKRDLKVFMVGVIGDTEGRFCNFAQDNGLEGLDSVRVRRFGGTPQFYSVSPWWF